LVNVIHGVLFEEREKWDSMVARRCVEIERNWKENG
jgi:hypothetical protein